MSKQTIKKKRRKRPKKIHWRKIYSKKEGQENIQAWKKSLASRKPFLIKFKSKWNEYQPEPRRKVRRKLIAKMDIVKLGGVGRAFTLSRFKQRLMQIKVIPGAYRYLHLYGRAKDKKGVLIKDRFIDKEIGADIKMNRPKLLQVAYTWLKQQIFLFEWVVSEKQRRRRKFKGERIKSLMVEITFIETWNIKRKKKYAKRKIKKVKKVKKY